MQLTVLLVAVPEHDDFADVVQWLKDVYVLYSFNQDNYGKCTYIFQSLLLLSKEKKTRNISNLQAWLDLFSD